MDDKPIKSEIAQSWDNESLYYDECVGHGVKTIEEKQLWKEAFLSVLPEKKQLSVLDVGCGTGAMGLILSEMGHDVTGIDLSEKMMEIGKEKSGKHGLAMKFLTGDAEYPPFAEDSFDVVINRHLLWTLPNPGTALANWYRVLKPEGILMVIDGVWNDGTLVTQICRNLSSTIADIFEPHRHGEKGYSDEIKKILPNSGGVPDQTAQNYFSDVGFVDISIMDLMNIRENQRAHLLWYQKLAAGKNYYLISGKKSEKTV